MTYRTEIETALDTIITDEFGDHSVPPHSSDHAYEPGEQFPHIKTVEKDGGLQLTYISGAIPTEKKDAHRNFVASLGEFLKKYPAFKNVTIDATIPGTDMPKANPDITFEAADTLEAATTLADVRRDFALLKSRKRLESALASEQNVLREWFPGTDNKALALKVNDLVDAAKANFYKSHSDKVSR